MNIKNTLLATALFGAALQAQAGTIIDNYVGGDSHGFGDVISDSATRTAYNITSAVVTRVDTLLTVVIKTGFAGQAGKTATPVGYGDLFLSNVWTPGGPANCTSEGCYASDNMSNGTQWKFAVSLDNAQRTTNPASNSLTTTLYTLKDNATSVLDSTNVMRDANISGTFRNGQADIVNKNTAPTSYETAGTATAYRATPDGPVRTGTMGIDSLGGNITFQINIAGTDMMKWDSFAIHWGETCQNDVIEGITSVPEPRSIALLGLGLAGLMVARRRKMH